MMVMPWMCVTALFIGVLMATERSFEDTVLLGDPRWLYESALCVHAQVQQENRISRYVPRCFDSNYVQNCFMSSYSLDCSVLAGARNLGRIARTLLNTSV